MGTARATSRSSKKGHANLPSDKQRRSRRSAIPVSILWSRTPKAGMIYPFAPTVMKNVGGDIAILTAIRKTLGVQIVNASMVDGVLARIFEEATAVLQQQRRQQNDNKFKDDPQAFMRFIRASPALREWWTYISVHLFTSVFLILRAARQNWHKKPRQPHDIAAHGKMAHAIDAFSAVDDINWGGAAFVAWLVKGGLKVTKLTRNDDDNNDNKRDGDGDDDGDDDGDTTMQEDDQDGKAGGHAAFQPSVEDIVEGMRRLNVDVDQTALTEAFAQFGVQDGVEPAPLMDNNFDWEGDSEIL
ncbi:hypothetical protein C8A00DRAFT_38879 [Chaetomidium leptoderma]|uniref:Uncharacterized protein n=1 Tax=Chaetomidium leptoderma TaxID=669021 RepID=A0AAN6VDJ7_9PEZI|nr:hypothetical protein C8A00DRAFT_38879 [Chaetomidium leptoderma]